MVKSITFRRIRNAIIIGICVFVIAVGIALMILGGVLNKTAAILFYLIFFIGLCICCCGIALSVVMTTILGWYEAMNGPLKATRKYLLKESIKHYTDTLDFKIESIKDSYKAWVNVKIPIGRKGGDPKAPMQYRYERKLVTKFYNVYYLHITNRYPPTAEQEKEEGFYFNIPKVTWTYNNTQPPVNTNVARNVVVPMQPPPGQQMQPMQPQPMQNDMNSMGGPPGGGMGGGMNGGPPGGGMGGGMVPGM